MLALVRKRTKFATIALFVSALGSLASCATRKEEVRLVNDPSAHPESTIPWNRQEKWEVGAGFPDAMRGEGIR